MQELLQMTGWFCHRNPERSLHLVGDWEFCARCTGIYWGSIWLLSAMLIFRRTVVGRIGRMQAGLLLVLIILTPAEVVAEALGFPGGNLLRFLLGIATGSGIMGLFHLRPHHGGISSVPDTRIVAASVTVAILVSVALLPPVSILGSWLSSRMVVLSSQAGLFVFIGSLSLCAFRLITIPFGTKRCHSRGRT